MKAVEEVLLTDETARRVVDVNRHQIAESAWGVGVNACPMEMRRKVIVFLGVRYGILSLLEFSVLLSEQVRIRGAPSRAAILARYGHVTALIPAW